MSLSNITFKSRTAKRPTKTQPVPEDSKLADAPKLVEEYDVPTFGAPAEPIKLTRAQQKMIMAQTKTLDEELPEAFIEDIILTPHSYEELVEHAACEIDPTETKGKRVGSIDDPRMGVVHTNEWCTTCGKNGLECPGHIGYIKLSQGIYHPLFLREVIACLNSVCYYCGNLLVPKEKIQSEGGLKYTGKSRLMFIEKLSSKHACLNPACKEFTQPYFITQDLKDKRKVRYAFVKPKTSIAKIQPKDITIMPAQSLNPKEKTAYSILNAISQDDSKTLGFELTSHPRNFVLRALPVIPPTARKPMVEHGIMKPDQITKNYNSIIKKNMEAKEVLVKLDLLEPETDEYDDKVIEFNERVSAMENEISKLMNNNAGKYKSSGGQNHVSIQDIMQGKNGIIRNLLMGKRVKFTARSVLSPDPSLKFGQIRLPLFMAAILTIEVRVNSTNIKQVIQWGKLGKISYVVPYKGKFANQKLEWKEKYTPASRDIIHRHLMDGDMVIFNRQPTLHKESFMAYEVVLSSPLTIGLHMSYTTPANADFDGDTAAISVPQGPMAQAELREILNVKKCLLDGQRNKAMMGLVYNAASGTLMLTGYWNTYGVDLPKLSNAVRFYNNDQIRKALREKDSNTLFNTLMDIKGTKLPEDYTITLDDQRLIKEWLAGRPLEEYIRVVRPKKSGYPDDYELTQADIQFLAKYAEKKGMNIRVDKDVYNNVLMSLTTLPDLKEFEARLARFGVPKYSGHGMYSILFPEDFYYERDTVKIVQGVILQGPMTKAHVGPTSNSIVQMLEIKYGPERASQFVTDASFLVQTWMNSNPLTVGIQDCTPVDEDQIKKVQTDIAKARLLVESFGPKADDPVEEAIREKNIKMAVAGVVNTAGSRVLREKMDVANPLHIMATSKAKGSVENVAQMTSLVGPQFFQGELLKRVMSGGTRCLPYFPENDESIESRGFCVHSFTDGLDPAELIMLQMAGRQGLMDTALNTAETGFLHRKMVKALEDVKVSFDGSVRNANNVIFQFAYGEDGLDPSRMQSFNIGPTSIVSFIDVSALSKEINSEYGFY